MSLMPSNSRRRRSWPFQIIGLTGSVAMGKSTAAALLRSLGLAVFDADAAVHQLLGPGGAAVPEVDARFAGVVENGAVDRRRLGKMVFQDATALKDLEAILHPMVRTMRHTFLTDQARRRASRVVLDIPLLFETGGQTLCDTVLVVSAPRFLQRQRVMRRPGMTGDQFSRILSKQMPDAEKRRLADHVIFSGLGRHDTLRRLRRILSKKH